LSHFAVNPLVTIYIDKQASHVTTNSRHDWIINNFSLKQNSFKSGINDSGASAREARQRSTMGKKNW